MMVLILPQGKIHRYDRAMSLVKLLNMLDIDPQTHLVARGDDLLTLDAQLDKDDEIKIIPVMSGG